jgi:DNA-directed RNA polymerase alpha subunit
MINKCNNTPAEIRKYFKDKTIENTNLSNRIKNCLSDMGVYDISDLLKISTKQLLQQENLGNTSILEIDNLLKEYKLKRIEPYMKLTEEPLEDLAFKILKKLDTINFYINKIIKNLPKEKKEKKL